MLSAFGMWKWIIHVDKTHAICQCRAMSGQAGITVLAKVQFRWWNTMRKLQNYVKSKQKQYPSGPISPKIWIVGTLIRPQNNAVLSLILYRNNSIFLNLTVKYPKSVNVTSNSEGATMQGQFLSLLHSCSQLSCRVVLIVRRWSDKMAPLHLAGRPRAEGADANRWRESCGRKVRS